MTSVDITRGTKQRDKLTIAEVCADLGISRRTFYEWRAKHRAPKCRTAVCASAGPSTSAGWLLTRKPPDAGQDQLRRSRV